MEPPGDADFRLQPGGFPRQGDEDILGNLLSGSVIISAAAGGGKHQIQMALHDRLKSAF